MTLEALNDDFRDVVLTFADLDVECLIVGAFALAFHGAPRASGDIDLLVRPSAENAERVFQALERFGVISRLGYDEVSRLSSPWPVLIGTKWCGGVRSSDNRGGEIGGQ